MVIHRLKKLIFSGSKFTASMKITVTLGEDSIFTLDVSEDLEVENFKALMEFESGVPASQLVLFYNGVQLQDNKKSLSSYQVKEGDVLLMQRRAQQPRQQPQAASNPVQGGPMNIDWSSIQLPVGGDGGASQPRQRPASARQQQSDEDADSPEAIRKMFLSDPHRMSLLKERNPELAEALLSGNIQQFTSILERQQRERADKEMHRIRTMNADPFDAEAQREIAEDIRMSNVNQNMETAMEYSPESFGRVIMLYINCKLNGHPVKAFIDSGAQMTFMSSACAERCNIMRLIDHRWAGMAKGVGTQRITGRVHVAQIQIENDFLPSAFSVLEEQAMDLVVGLDMLKRHQCCIDLKRSVLQIGTTGTETPFLPEGELPECARLSGEPEKDNSIQEFEDKELAEAISKSSREMSNNLGSSNAGTSGSSNAGSNQVFPEASIQQITRLGFSREQAVKELRAANGNAELAAAALLAKSLQMPS